MEDIIDEYKAYANPKVRPGDISLIKSFDPSAVFTYAKQTGFIGGDHPKFRPAGMPPMTNIDELAHELGKAGRLDSLTSSETIEALDNLSATVSEMEIGSPAVQQPNTASSANPTTAQHPGSSTMVDCIDPRLLTSSHSPRDHMQMGITVVEVEQDASDEAEALALRGELDPMLDHEDMAESLY